MRGYMNIKLVFPLRVFNTYITAEQIDLYTDRPVRTGVTFECYQVPSASHVLNTFGQERQYGNLNAESQHCETVNIDRMCIPISSQHLTLYVADIIFQFLLHQ
jgi:hypothetical protein